MNLLPTSMGKARYVFLLNENKGPKLRLQSSDIIRKHLVYSFRLFILYLSGYYLISENVWRRQQYMYNYVALNAFYYLGTLALEHTKQYSVSSFQVLIKLDRYIDLINLMYQRYRQTSPFVEKKTVNSFNILAALRWR